MGPDGIAAGDFNGDGKLDLAVANSGMAEGHNNGTQREYSGDPARGW